MMCLLQDVGLQNNEMDITKILKDHVSIEETHILFEKLFESP